MEQLTIDLEMDREEKRRDQSPKVCEIKNVFNPAIQNEKDEMSVLYWHQIVLFSLSGQTTQNIRAKHD